jgi:phosphatidylcholine synthase
MTQLDQLHPIVPRRLKGDDPVARLLAWCVHLYTALGLAAAAAIAVLLVQGGANSFRWSFVLMLAATLVDATDGTMARRVGVKKVLPNFDGRKLDDLTDFLTYTFLPLLLIWRAEILPVGLQFWLLLPLLASAYGFCQVEAKTDDGYFLGFPSLWNVVALYLYVLRLPPWLALGVLVVLSLLTFVPSRYLYPTSRPGPLNILSNVLGAAWACLLAVILQQLPAGPAPSPGVGDATWNLALISLFYPAFYMIASWSVTLRRWCAIPRRDLR